ncbi:unnamed protein product, partial [Heterosigma akashiwo]
LERVELSDSDDEEEFKYENVAEDDLDSDGESEDEDFAAALASVQQKHDVEKSETYAEVPKETATQVRPSVVDDFIRNFLIKVNMTRTLDTFNTEWYELQAKGRLGEEHTSAVPDIYLKNEELDEQVQALRQQLEKMAAVTE